MAHSVCKTASRRPQYSPSIEPTRAGRDGKGLKAMDQILKFDKTFTPVEDGDEWSA